MRTSMRIFWIIICSIALINATVETVLFITTDYQMSTNSIVIFSAFFILSLLISLIDTIRSK